MTALVKQLCTFQTAKRALVWPVKNFPNNAIMTLAGAISLVALPKMLNSYYYSALLGALTLAGLKIHQMNNDALKQIAKDKGVQGIKKEIRELEGFEDNNLKIMNLYLKLGKETIEPMFNPFNHLEYAKIEKLATFCKVSIENLATIWTKHPNFDGASHIQRRALFIERLTDKKEAFTAVCK